jgi:hypothetical protein
LAVTKEASIAWSWRVVIATYFEEVGGQLVEGAVIRLSWLSDSSTFTPRQKDLLEGIAVGVLECLRRQPACLHPARYSLIRRWSDEVDNIAVL